MTRALILSALILSPLAAHAQPPTADQRVAQQRSAEAQGAFVEALSRQWRGDHEGAIRMLDRLIQGGVPHAAVYDALAESHAALGHYAEALLAAEDAGRLSPDDADVLARLAQEQRRSGQHEAAAATLERAIRVRPGDPTLLADLADLYTEVGDDDQAVRTLERLVRVGDTPAARLRLAAYARQSADLGRAVEHLARATQLAPDAAAVAVALADALAEAGRLSDGVSALDRYLRRRPGDVDALSARARLTGEEGPSSPRTDSDRLARARDAYEAGLEDPGVLEEAEEWIAPLLTGATDPGALALGGRIAFERRDYPTAAERLLLALDADPRDAQGWALLLRALARSKDDRAARTADDALLFFSTEASVAEGAAEAFLSAGLPSRALAAAPESPDGLAIRALALIALDRNDDAEDALNRAERASPLFLEAARGDLAASRGDTQGAREAWTRALAADPEAAWVAARLR